MNKEEQEWKEEFKHRFASSADFGDLGVSYSDNFKSTANVSDVINFISNLLQKQKIKNLEEFAEDIKKEAGGQIDLFIDLLLAKQIWYYKDRNN